jgi:hypothetical protein
LVCAFEFVIQPVSLLQQGALNVFLTEWQVAKALLVPVAMLMCFLGGWRSPRWRTVLRADLGGEQYNGRTLWRWGCSTASVGLALEIAFLKFSGGIIRSFSEPHGAAMRDEETAAYLYTGTLWILTGIAMVVIARRTRPLTTWERLMPWAFAMWLYLRGILTASRGWIFMTTACLLAAHGLSRARPVRLSKVAKVILLACVGALLMLGYREVLHLGEHRPAAPSLIEAVAAGMTIRPEEVARRETGFEFLYHAAIIDTVDATQKYHWGLNWLYVFTLHPVPRVWWPDKPYGFNTPGINLADIAEVTGLRRPGGAAPGLVADLYRNFGLASAALWWVLGKASRKVYLSAQRFTSVSATVGYVLLYSLSLQLFAQSLQGVLPTLTYALIPVMAYRLLHREPRIRATKADFSVAKASFVGLSRCGSPSAR